jgi:hypothetical protein
MAFQNPVGEISSPRFPLASHSPHADEVVKRAWEELRALRRQRADIMKRIGTVRQTILGLATLFEGSMSDDELLDVNGRKANGRQTGFTKAIRIVLMQSRTPLRAAEVRDLLETQGISLLHHKGPLASVTTVLNRLVQYGEAQVLQRSDGKRVWAWVKQVTDSYEGTIPQEQ